MSKHDGTIGSIVCMHFQTLAANAYDSSLHVREFGGQAELLKNDHPEAFDVADGDDGS